MKSVKHIAAYACLGGALWAGAAIAQSPKDVVLNQQERVEEICRRAGLTPGTPTGSALVAELLGLTNYFRGRALRCMLPKQSFVLLPGDVAAVVGDKSTQQFRREWICRLSRHLPVDTDSAGFGRVLGDLTGYERTRAIRCLGKQIETEFTAAEVIRILGPIMPENDPAWTRMSYRYSDHHGAVCSLAENLGGDLTAEETTKLLGLSRNHERYRILQCLVGKVAFNLNWEDVDLILSASIRNNGQMIDLLGERTPDGRNATTLKRFHGKFASRRFLLDPDPPSWLQGQCVAWAKLAYAEVADRPFSISVGVARNIPERAVGSGYHLETDPRKARVGALAVWDDGGAGHVAIVTAIKRNDTDGLADRITISEANWGRATPAAAREWGTDMETARREYITSRYGRFDYASFSTSELDRPPPGGREPRNYKFARYILP
jgi:surface antigen